MALIRHWADCAQTRIAASVAPLRRVAMTCGIASLFGLILSGCGTNRVRVATEEATVDPRQTHPIALVEKQYKIDVFPQAPLDDHTRYQIIEFAELYRRQGHGPITILAPTGAPQTAQTAKAIGSIRGELIKQRVGAHVMVSHYPAVDPGLAAPVRLSFDGMGAKVTHKCGEWPRDLGVGSANSSWENKPYYNFGCSSQSMLASQVDDARDLAAPRATDAADMVMRVRGIKKVREGMDPGTNWKVQNSKIGAVGE